MSESIIFNFRIWIGHGLHEKVSDWIRIAKFPYPYTTGLFRLCSLSFRDGQRFGFGSYIILFLLDLDWISIF